MPGFGELQDRRGGGGEVGEEGQVGDAVGGRRGGEGGGEVECLARSDKGGQEGGVEGGGEGGGEEGGVPAPGVVVVVTVAAGTWR